MSSLLHKKLDKYPPGIKVWRDTPGVYLGTNLPHGVGENKCGRRWGLQIFTMGGDVGDPYWISPRLRARRGVPPSKARRVYKSVPYSLFF